MGAIPTLNLCILTNDSDFHVLMMKIEESTLDFHALCDNTITTGDVHRTTMK